jgi:hypothetical protein
LTASPGFAVQFPICWTDGVSVGQLLPPHPLARSTAPAIASALAVY